MPHQNSLSCLIVEDELLPAELLGDYIRQVPFLALAGHCTDAIYAQEWLREHRVDIIFLDIHLPKLRGLDFLALQPNPPLIVLTTAYDQYALDGYRFEVVDYLLKPYDFARFYEAAEKLRRRAGLVKPLEADQHLLFKVNKQQVRVLPIEILYVESLKEYARIHLSDRHFLTQVSLQELEQRLPASQFLRIHRSYMVNIDKIRAFSAHEIEIAGVSLPIGRTYAEFVHLRLGE
jgi:DNA-binding LytR/AlgR family response regulator